MSCKETTNGPRSQLHPSTAETRGPEEFSVTRRVIMKLGPSRPRKGEGCFLSQQRTSKAAQWPKKIWLCSSHQSPDFIGKAGKDHSTVWCENTAYLGSNWMVRAVPYCLKRNRKSSSLNNKRKGIILWLENSEGLQQFHRPTKCLFVPCKCSKRVSALNYRIYSQRENESTEKITFAWKFGFSPLAYIFKI